MKLISKSKNLNETKFIERLQNGYVLFAKYEYTEKSKIYWIYYKLSREKEKKQFLMSYRLERLEGEPDADFHFGYSSKGEKVTHFSTVQEVLKYLKEKEKFKLADWGCQR